jgi:uncharacterized iron-regulated membrane protein
VTHYVLANKKTDKAKGYATLTDAMKKRLILLFAMTGLAWLAAMGCSNKNIDTAKVRAAFQSLSGDSKDTLEQALRAIDRSNYVAADRPLKVLAFKVKMDKNQRVILLDTIAKVEAKAAKQK